MITFFFYIYISNRNLYTKTLLFLIIFSKLVALVIFFGGKEYESMCSAGLQYDDERVKVEAEF